ncbi:13370_t:CDS:10 [Acaulospora morrowiae]|uniref:13370_t:CDS:1 n=1 Tax=Acaulospora morrowiae TaxID=94023 RepID=A0A9N9C7I7_9GLOM|nr:13370_t:CDS:10 [Acaulospora morrowiae]
MSENTDDRLLGVFSGICWNVNNMIGSGIFVTPGIVWQSMGSPGAALMLWIGGAVITLSASLSYTELGTRISEQGGELAYLRKTIPRPHNLFSFLFSFMFLFAIRVGSIGAVSQAFAQYLVFSLSTSDDCTRYLQVNPKNGWKDINFWILKIAAIGSLLLVTIYHILSSNLANRINNVLACIKTITLFTIAICGLANLKSTYNNWGNLFEGTTLTIGSFSTSLISVLFSYNGWNNLNYSLGEFRRPEARLAYSNLISVSIVSVLCRYIYDYRAQVEAKNPGYDFNEVIAGYFAEHIGGRQFGQALSFFVAVSAFGTLGALVWSGSRVVQRTAKMGYFLIGRKWLQVMKKDGTPVNTLKLQFIGCTLIIVAIGWVTSDPFKFLSDYSQYSYWIFYCLTGIGLLIWKSEPSKEKHFNAWWLAR